MRTNFKVGKLYYIKFLDHSMGSKDKMMIEVVGWCLKDDKEHAVFTAWQVISDDKEMVNNNHEPFSIIKACMKKKRILNVS